MIVFLIESGSESTSHAHGSVTLLLVPVLSRFQRSLGTKASTLCNGSLKGVAVSEVSQTIEFVVRG